MYPIWEVPHLTAGMVLGLIATFHILPSHLSVSAMWLNVWLERKAVLEGRPELMPFVRRYAKFILVFCYVFGSLSGVGIWFAATAASPRGISALIHNFVWGWATEWVFFLIEVSGIFVYAYTFDKLDERTHLRLGLVFAAASWLTMVVIVGILTFMMTPGAWNTTGAFFDGFFNQSYWPQLFFRTTSMFSIAAVYAVVVAAREPAGPARDFVVRAAGLWGLAGLALAAPCLLWYRASLPEAVRGTLDALLTPGLKAAMLWAPVVTALYFAGLAWRPRAARFVPALAAVAVLFAGIFAFERARELGRKPWVLPGYMVSSGFVVGDLPAKGAAAQLPRLASEGVLASAPFVPAGLRTVTDLNRVEAGRMVALLECSACHTLDKAGVRPLPALVRRVGLSTPEDLAAWLDGLGAYPYMPPFIGNDADKRALAAFLAKAAE
ncbi:cytochrome c [bacterium]|nr:MAG: cytochrome c [bacterium]